MRVQVDMNERYISIYLFVYLYIYSYLAIQLYIHISIYPSIHLPSCLSAYLSAWLSVYLWILSLVFFWTLCFLSLPPNAWTTKTCMKCYGTIDSAQHCFCSDMFITIGDVCLAVERGLASLN